LYGAEIRCFLSTTTKAVRNDPLCPVTIEPVTLDNFREGITMILVKEFRAGIPACPAADACHSIDSHVHQVIPSLIPQIGVFQIKECAPVFFLTDFLSAPGDLFPDNEDSVVKIQIPYVSS
jgi:hypothetical protein